MNKEILLFANRLGIFFVILFAICFAWFYIRPIEQDLHMRLFRLAFFGFSEMNGLSFLLGAAQSYIWAYIVAILWKLVGLPFQKR